MCQVAREKPGTRMDRLSVRPGRVHTAHCKDASTEQARERDLESAHRSWTETRQLGKALAIPRRRWHKGRTCPGLHGLPREMTSWGPPSTVQWAWTPSAHPAEWQRDQGQLGDAKRLTESPSPPGVSFQRPRHATLGQLAPCPVHVCLAPGEKETSLGCSTSLH